MLNGIIFFEFPPFFSSLDKARARPLLKGKKVHVTKSVKPEPKFMKGIVNLNYVVGQNYFRRRITRSLYIIYHY